MASYLKSLDLQGFKSFGTKTRIEFAEGITGIVGPNGCGKSNVVEAVKWVLGEQSAKSLRGDRMQDVIFNGTAHRSPSGMAEAILTFDNEKAWLPLEYPEVSISRRLFRSGEGQYYINGARSRLKDNIELFLDTGIGRDSYAIFEQGKIDRLLSESAEERRILFEDFAGISKFKFRKEEAEKKLALARENLERIQETIDRLEREMVTLEHQARDAETYKELSTALNGAELKFGAARLQNMRREIEKRQREQAALQNALAPLTEELTNIENQAAKSEEAVAERETFFGALNERYRSLTTDLAKTQADRRAAQTLLEENQNSQRQLEIRAKQDRERLEEGEEELAEKRDAASDAEKKEGASRLLLGKAEELQNQIKALTEALETALLQSSRDLGFPRAVTRSDSDLIRRDIAELKGRVFHFEAEIISQEDILKTKTLALQREEALLGQLEEAFGKAVGAAEGAEASKTALNQKIRAKEQEIKGWEARQKQLLEESKGCDRQILEALNHSADKVRAFNKTRPALSEAFNGALLQLEEAVRRGGAIAPELIGNLKKAAAESDAAHQALAASLLGEDFTRKLALLEESDSLLASLEAERAALEQLKAQAPALGEAEALAQGGRNRAENEFKGAEREFKKLQSEAEQAKMAADRAKSDLFNAKQASEAADSKLNAIEKAIHTYDEGHASLRDRRNAVQEELGNARVSFTGLEAHAKALRSEVRSLEIRLDDLRRSLANVSGDQAALQSRQSSLKEDIQELLALEDELNPEISKAQAGLASSAEEIQELHRARKVLESLHRGSLEKYNKLRLRESEMEGALSERLQTYQTALESLREQFHREDISVELDEADTLENLQASIKGLKEKLYRMGDVNMMAVEQFQTAQDHCRELIRQKADIEAAASDTEALIAETNTESSEKFMKAFEDIRRSFKELFAQLFDGGRADLLLLDKSDPLSSGIDIMAEPPGQKFQSVSLLSGGQRAMVAIAVIFSMLKLKPTPFIILDEMDAPLDDENIERFKSLLRRFKDMGQFVIVSHSKSTLEVCDALFGVTMEELGCSKVLSVAFDEADELIFQ